MLSDSVLAQSQHAGRWFCEFDSYANLPAQLEQTMLKLVGANVSDAYESIASDAALAAAYHLNSGGQRIRGRLALGAGLALGLSKKDALSIAATAELLHNASLVHDDLQDHDAQRHGQPAVWMKFGANVAVCTGDLMLSTAYAALCGVSQAHLHLLPTLLALVHERVATAIAGQSADLSATEDRVNDLARYKRIATAKSGALLGLPLELVLIASGHAHWSKHALGVAEAFSVGYQVVDDLADVERDSQSGALNIVSVLRLAGFGNEAHEQAKKFGLEHLDIALKLASKLPCESGALLTELSVKLRNLLLTKSD